MKGVIETEQVAMVVEEVVRVIWEHIPSITDEIESELDDRLLASTSFGGDGEAGDCALRVCHCGARIDGFYEYVDHLKAVIQREVV